MSKTTFNVQAASWSVALKVEPPMTTDDPCLNLASPDGQWMLRVPRAAFPVLNPATGETLIAGLSLVHLGEVTEPLSKLIKPSGLTLVKGH